MLDWFKSLFGSHEDCDLPEAEQSLDTSIETIPSFPELKQVVLDAFTQASNEIADAENQLLFDPKLKTYIAKFTKNFISKAISNGDSYDIVLVYPLEAGIPKNSFKAFLKLIRAVYKEFGIEINHEKSNDYVVINKRDAQELIKQLKAQKLENLDSKLSEIIAQGPYR